MSPQTQSSARADGGVLERSREGERSGGRVQDKIHPTSEIPTRCSSSPQPSVPPVSFRFSPGTYREQRSDTAPKQRRCSTSNSHLFLSRCARLAYSQSAGTTINNQLAHCSSTSNSLPSSKPGQLCRWSWFRVPAAIHSSYGRARVGRLVWAGGIHRTDQRHASAESAR